MIPGAENRLRLPGFRGYKYPEIMRVLHHEILINIKDGLPVPDFYVYPKPWRRDAAMMAMCLKAPGNTIPTLAGLAIIFTKKKKSPVSNRDYPLTWETNASQGNYRGMAQVDSAYVKGQTCSPNTWHASEIFLYLPEIKK